MVCRKVLHHPVCHQANSSKKDVRAGCIPADRSGGARQCCRRLLDHLAKDRRHTEAIDRLVAQRINTSPNNQGNEHSKNKRKFKVRTIPGSNVATGSPAPFSSTPSTSTAQESAGVAILSNVSYG